MFWLGGPPILMHTQIASEHGSGSSRSCDMSFMDMSIPESTT